MNVQSRQFQLSNETAREAILERISSDLTLGEATERSVSRVFYDSFDWRLFSGGGELQAQRQGRTRILAWCDRNGGTSDERLTLQGEMPVFCWDLPQGALRARLEPLLEMRALLPQVEVRSGSRVFPVLDDEAKTVARVVLETHEARDPGKGEYRRLPGRVALLPVRGYDEASLIEA